MQILQIVKHIQKWKQEDQEKCNKQQKKRRFLKDNASGLACFSPYGPTVHDLLEDLGLIFLIKISDLSCCNKIDNILHKQLQADLILFTPV